MVQIGVDVSNKLLNICAIYVIDVLHLRIMQQHHELASDYQTLTAGMIKNMNTT